MVLFLSAHCLKIWRHLCHLLHAVHKFYTLPEICSRKKTLEKVALFTVLISKQYTCICSATIETVLKFVNVTQIYRECKILLVIF